MIDINQNTLEKISIDYSATGSWNCNKCVIFDDKTCTCIWQHRYMIGSLKGLDCEDCKYPFVLKESEVNND